MKLLILALFGPCLLAYPLQQSYLLDAAATSITVHNSGSGGADQAINFVISGSQRIRLTASGVQIPPPSGTTFTACAAPCTLSINENWGDSYIWAERV